MKKINAFCLGLWVKWSIFIENVRLKVEDKFYKWEKKLDDKR